MYEVEIKVEIDQVQYKRLSIQLQSNLEYEALYKDVYFDTEDKSLAKDECELRVRQIIKKTDQVYLLTYKERPFDQVTKSKPEYEINVSDSEVLKAIIQRLGYVEDVVIEKKCKNYKVHKNGYPMRITLAYIGQLQKYYLEIEIMQEEKSDISKTKQTLYDYLEDIDIDKKKVTNTYYTDLIRR